MKYNEQYIKDLFFRMYGMRPFSCVPVVLNVYDTTVANIKMTPVFDAKSMFFGNLTASIAPSAFGTSVQAKLKLNGYNPQTATVEPFHMMSVDYKGASTSSSNFPIENLNDTFLYSISAVDAIGNANAIFSLQLVGWKITF